MDNSPIAKTLGRLPSGLFVLTVHHQGQETGMLASWVMQAGFDPPMVSVAVRKGRYVAKWIDAGAPFALNLLSEGDKATLRHFARGFEPGEPAFDGVEILRTSRGVPVLPATVGYLECKMASRVDSGDHCIFLAQVSNGSCAEKLRPMVHIRNNGLRY
jgi:flavin reductase (DIM6/NTAB) family NADH-FMN oxidoreductase RutF